MDDSSAAGEVVAPVPAVTDQNTSGVVGVLAEALAQHQWRGSFLGCKCGWNWSEPLTHGCGEDERIGHAHREHVASVIAALPNIAIELVPERTLQLEHPSEYWIENHATEGIL